MPHRTSAHTGVITHFDIDCAYSDKVNDIGGRKLLSFVPRQQKLACGKLEEHRHSSHIVRTPMTVTRVKHSKADLGLGNAHTVEVEIAFDDPSTIPQMLEREARVTFL